MIQAINARSLRGANAGPADASALEREVAQLEEAKGKERDGLFNVPGRFLTDLFADSGEDLEKNVGKARAALSAGMADGRLDAAEAAAVRAPLNQGKQDLKAFEKAKELGGNLAGAAAMFFAPVALAARPLRLLQPALWGAGLNVAGHAFIQGKGYSPLDIAQDAAVGGATMAVGAALGSKLFNSRLHPVAAGALVGAGDNAVYGALQQGFRDGNWDEGAGKGLARVGVSTALSAGIGAGAGAIGGALVARGRSAQSAADDSASAAALSRGGSNQTQDSGGSSRRSGRR